MQSKYKAVATTVDNIVFHSAKEANRYLELKALLRSAIITDLDQQPKFPIVINGHKCCVYTGDFQYLDEQYRVVVEDVKGYKAGGAYAMFRLKAKLVEAVHGVRILET